MPYSKALITPLSLSRDNIQLKTSTTNVKKKKKKRVITLLIMLPRKPKSRFAMHEDNKRKRSITYRKFMFYGFTIENGRCPNLL